MEDLYHIESGRSRAARYGDRPYATVLLDANRDLAEVVASAASLEDARDALYEALARRERELFSINDALHPLERATALRCVHALRSLIAPLNERRSGTSALALIYKILKKRPVAARSAFVAEIEALFKGAAALSGIYSDDGAVMDDEVPEFARLSGRPAARVRTEVLDTLARSAHRISERYPSGLGRDVVERRRRNAARVLEALGGSAEDWQDYRWHLAHVITDAETLLEIVEVEDDLAASLRAATKHGLPVGMTPYYVSLMDRAAGSPFDAAIRAQVLPPPEYVAAVQARQGHDQDALDFMGEHDTSPVDLVTRRYPGICIFKPYNTCSQICVYCQRNWEIDECMAPDALASQERIDAALDWIASHDQIGDVLVTGGDPAVLDDDLLAPLLERLAAIEHVYRIRLGTRTPVVLPFRWTTSLADLLGRLHEPGRREIAVMTHFEHSYEITPEAMTAVRRIRCHGIGVYNQEVFTTFNSRRFESAKLRLDLRRIGVDPYYTFNTKGKDETSAYRVPIARILQERKEEARLLPGLDRTDEPVFNVPRLGKHHLRATSDRSLIGLSPEGCRVYEFHPWEKNIAAVPTYIGRDVPILDYLETLEAAGENPRDYESIWYYF